MKVLFLTRRYLPHHGGVEKHLSEVIAHLPTEFQVTVVTEQHDAQLPLSEKNDRATVLRIPIVTNKSLKIQIWSWWFRHFNLLLNTDVVHVHDVYFWLLPLRFFLWFKPVFMTFHGYEGHDPQLKEKFWHKVAAFFSEGSIAAGKFHQKWYGVDSDFYTYGGVDETKFHLAKKQNLERETVKKFVFVGRLASDTGIEMYLAAIHQLQQQQKKVHLDIYGDGSLREKLEKIVTKNNLPVTFHGQQNITAQVYQNADFSFVSGYLSMLEALASGSNVIAVTNPEQEIKSDYLYMTPFAKWITIANSPEEIVTAVQNNSLLPVEAQSWAQAQTWQKVTETYLQLWEKYS
jgi:glycosyltransferase involved in cell wall biosynthesis